MRAGPRARPRGEVARERWYRHWIAAGFAAFEASLAAGGAGRFCHGDAPGLADACLIPQLFNARRFACDLSGYPRMLGIEAACAELPAFVAAHPARQPDADSA